MVSSTCPAGPSKSVSARATRCPTRRRGRSRRESPRARARARAGVVHRDLKPANVLFDEEGDQGADFGIARMTAGMGTLTEAGTVVGTAAYMSPEQAAGEGATPATDVYSFGVILYRMLTGRLPFESTNAVDLVRRQVNELPPPVSAFRSDAPQDLAAVAEDSLAKEPAERPPDGSALVGLLTGATAATLGGAATQVMPAAGAHVVAQPRTGGGRRGRSE